jgi:hypothetical protein
LLLAAVDRGPAQLAPIQLCVAPRSGEVPLGDLTIDSDLNRSPVTPAAPVARCSARTG